MTTVGDAIKDALYDNWAGSGGTRPALYSTEDESMWPSDDDWIMMLGWTFVEKEKPRNDAFKGVKHYIDIRVHSRNDANKEERLDTIVTEIKRIVIPDNVTGYNLVRIIDQNRRASDRRIHSYIAELTVELILLSTSSAVTPGTGGDGDVVFPADVDITGDLTVSGGQVGIGVAPDAETALYAKQSAVTGRDLHVDDVVVAERNDDCFFNAIAANNKTCGILMSDDERSKGAVYYNHSNNTLNLLANGVTINTAQIAALLMLGSANAAWIPAIYEATTEPGKVIVAAAYTISNVDDTDFWAIFRIPLPTTKGGLKLYISGYSVGILDADEGDYLSEIRLYGMVYSSATQVAVTTTDYTSSQKVEVTFGAIDMSGYDNSLVALNIVATNANDFDLMFVNVRCYYAA